eukprot:499299_1
MMSPDLLHWILFYASNSILILQIFIVIQQICITSFFMEKSRLRRLLLISIVILIFLTENSLVYLSAIYPNYVLFLSIDMTIFTALFESLVISIAYHTFRLLLVFIIKTVYDSIGIRAPKWFSYFVNILQFMVMIALFICYIFYFVTRNNDFIYLFYVILMLIIIIMTLFVIILLQRPLKILKQVQNANSSHQEMTNDTSHSEIAKGAFYLKVAVFAATFCCMVAILDLCINVEIIEDFFDVSWNFSLINILMHSVVFIVLAACLIVWIYKTDSCCQVREDSVCEIWCCFFRFENTDSMQNMMIQDLEHTSINTNKNITMLNETSANLSQLPQSSVTTM